MTTRPLRMPRYRQIATAIRAQVDSGQLRAGDELPGEATLARQHQVSLATVSAAIHSLCDEGLVVTVPGRRSRIRPHLPRTTIQLYRGDRIAFRMPDPAERQELGIPLGTPIAVITRIHDGSTEHHACDRTAFQTPSTPTETPPA